MCSKGHKYFTTIWDISYLFSTLHVLTCAKYFSESIWDTSDLWATLWTLVSHWESSRYCWRNSISETFLLPSISSTSSGDCNIIISSHKLTCYFQKASNDINKRKRSQLVQEKSMGMKVHHN